MSLIINIFCFVLFCFLMIYDTLWPNATFQLLADGSWNNTSKLNLWKNVFFNWLLLLSGFHCTLQLNLWKTVLWGKRNIFFISLKKPNMSRFHKWKSLEGFIRNNFFIDSLFMLQISYLKNQFKIKKKNTNYHNYGISSPACLFSPICQRGIVCNIIVKLK